jgi:hypothetical protein
MQALETEKRQKISSAAFLLEKPLGDWRCEVPSTD